jgi:hypothetical protein
MEGQKGVVGNSLDKTPFEARKGMVTTHMKLIELDHPHGELLH